MLGGQFVGYSPCHAHNPWHLWLWRMAMNLCMSRIQDICVYRDPNRRSLSIWKYIKCNQVLWKPNGLSVFEVGILDLVGNYAMPYDASSLRAAKSRQVIVSNTFPLSCGSRQKPIVQTYLQNKLSSIKAHPSRLCWSKPRFSRYSGSLGAISHPQEILWLCISVRSMNLQFVRICNLFGHTASLSR